MPGGTVIFTPFDGMKKGAWFWADVNGLLYTFIVIWCGGFLFGCVLIGLLSELIGISPEAIGTTVIAPLTFLALLAMKYCGVWGVVVMSFIPPFIVVFVLRRNFTVAGPRRQFRYFCRWI